MSLVKMLDLLQKGYSTEPGSMPYFDPVSDRDLSGSDAGPYRLVSRFSKRGAADLYLGVRRGDLSRQTVAIKVVDTAYTPASAMQLFNLERQLVGRFEHVHMARMLDEGTTSTGALYLTMEHIDALPITEFARRRSLTPPACIELILQLCSAIEYLHSKGFVHRDLRPENILVAASGELKIVDFRSTTAVGVPDRAVSEDTGEIRLLAREYASPEVCHGGSCARASDVYSMGILLHEMVTGIRPAPAGSPSVRVLKSTGSPDLDQVISRAIRTAPAERFRSAAEFAQRLQRLL